MWGLEVEVRADWCSPRVMGERLAQEKDRDNTGYGLRNAFGSVRAVTDTPEKFKEEPCEKRAATARLSVTVLPATQFKLVRGYMLSLQVVQQIIQC